MKFTEKVRSTAESYVKQLKAAEKAIADHRKNGATEYSESRFKEIAAELEERRREIRSEGIKEVQKAIDEYKAELSDRYAAKGNEVDSGDIDLLNSGYKLTPSDLAAMFDRHTGNNTMLRAVTEYCKDNSIDIGRKHYGEKEKAEAADIMRVYASNCFSRPDYGMETEEYFAGACPEALIGD